MKKILLSILFLLVTVSPAFARYVSVSWDAVVGATSYNLYWGSTSGIDPTDSDTYTYSITDSSITTNSHQVAINEETTYMVVTADDGIEGPASDEITIPYLTQDGYPTPEQIAMYLSDDGIGANAYVTMRYRKVGDVEWTTGHDLYRIKSGYSSNPSGFAWTIFDLDQGSDYLVEVTINDGSVVQVQSKIMTTSSLPAAAGDVTIPVNSGMSMATIEGLIDNAPAGSVIQFADGDYTLSGFTIRPSGTADEPIYIRGESRDGVRLIDTNDTVLSYVGASYVVLENMTIQGSGVNAYPPSSFAITINVGYNNGAQSGNLTFRNLTISDVDKGIIVAQGNTKQLMVYENIITGNNTWTSDDFNYSGSVAEPNGIADIDEANTWGDDGLYLGGWGNVAFNNTITGFGDTLASQGPGLDTSRSVHFYRNKIGMSGDDLFEGDWSQRNISSYDNYSSNSMTCVSADPVFGGPVYGFRNVCINVGRDAFKLNGGEYNQSGVFIYNNTIVHTLPKDGGRRSYVWLQSNQGAQDGFAIQNNILIYQNYAGNYYTMGFDSVDLDPIEFTHNSWYPGSENGAGAMRWDNTGGTYDTIALAVAGLPATSPIFNGGPTQRNYQDLYSELQPFTDTVTLGSNFKIEVTTEYDMSLNAQSVNNESGVEIVGITDGYSGLAPDRGAIISGIQVPAWGDRSSF